MRAQLISHFDVVVVVWALALGIAWTVVVLSRSQLSADQWSSEPPSGPIWAVYN
jgi:hypothetical protein